MSCIRQAKALCNLLFDTCHYASDGGIGHLPKALVLRRHLTPRGITTAAPVAHDYSDLIAVPVGLPEPVDPLGFVLLLATVGLEAKLAEHTSPEELLLASLVHVRRKGVQVEVEIHNADRALAIWPGNEDPLAACPFHQPFTGGPDFLGSALFLP